MDYVVIDLETANADYSSICQIGLVGVRNGAIASAKSMLIDPQTEFDPMNISIHGIKPEDVADAPAWCDVFPKLVPVIEPFPILHHTHFDKTATNQAFEKSGLPTPPLRWLDSTRIVRRVWADISRRGYGLSDLCQRFKIEYQAHDALQDALATQTILAKAFSESATSVEDWFDLAHKPLPPDPNPIMRRRRKEAVVRDTKAARGVIVFSGNMAIGRDTLQQMCRELGFTTPKHMSRKVTHLCVTQDMLDDPYLMTSKLEMALELQADGHAIEIITEEKFFDLVRA